MGAAAPEMPVSARVQPAAARKLSKNAQKASLRGALLRGREAFSSAWQLIFCTENFLPARQSVRKPGILCPPRSGGHNILFYNLDKPLYVVFPAGGGEDNGRFSDRLPAAFLLSEHIRGAPEASP